MNKVKLGENLKYVLYDIILNTKGGFVFMHNEIKNSDIVKEFELGTILTMTTGYNCTDNFDKIWNLVWFVCDDNLINTTGLFVVKDDIKKHLLKIHPELENVKYQKGRDLNKFLAEQEEKFGSILHVTKLGENLPEQKESDRKKLVKKNDLSFK